VTQGSTPRPLRDQFGDLDIYLFDQLLKGRIADDARILDAGCGHGRNLAYLMREGFDLWGVDSDERAIAATQSQAAALAPHLPAERFGVHPVERMAFGDAAFDVVISSAVLHFARDEAQWWAMVREMWRVLAPGGMLFARLAATIGHESTIKPLGNRRFILPDGTTRFLIDEAFLMSATAELRGELLDPLKTTVVQAARSMTTWVVRKAA
jgi:SAM-dependent methyltransferase